MTCLSNAITANSTEYIGDNDDESGEDDDDNGCLSKMAITAGSSSDIKISIVWSASLLTDSPTYLITHNIGLRVIFNCEMCDHNVQLPVKRVERVDVPAVLVEASHAIGRAVAEEPIQYFHLRRSTEINILPDFRQPLVQNVDEAAFEDRAVGSSFLSRRFPLRFNCESFAINYYR